MNKTNHSTDYIIVIPAFNEDENISPLLTRIVNVMSDLSYEIVVVDNGSTDKTADILESWLKDNIANIKVITLSRNFGYDGAIAAGLEHAEGRWCIIMDGDQQDPPEVIPEFISKANEGFDIVYGLRLKRTEGFITGLMIKLFYKIMKIISNVDMPKDAGNFSIISRRAVDVIVAMPERNKFIRGIRAWTGFSSTGIVYERDHRILGETKFSLFKYLNHAINGITSFSVFPLRILSYLGALGIIFCLLTGLFLFATKISEIIGYPILAYQIESGFTLVYLLILASISITLFGLGVIGEYVGKILEETKNRPNFIVTNIKSSES